MLTRIIILWRNYLAHIVHFQCSTLQLQIRVMVENTYVQMLLVLGNSETEVRRSEIL